MYDDRMKRAFRSLRGHAPKNFNLEVIDNNDFITLRISPHEMFALSNDDKRRALEYTMRVKTAFEDLGAFVLVLRKPIEEDRLHLGERNV